MISIVFFNGAFVNNDSTSIDAKLYSSLTFPHDFEFILADASKESLTTYLFCANRYNNDVKSDIFSIQYMDYILVLMKRSDVSIVLQAFNGFQKNLNFTVDTFQVKRVNFLNLLVDRNIRDIFFKDTHTGQYTNYSSFMPWKLNTSWVKSLYSRDSKICSSKCLLKNQIELIEQFMSWNNLPKYIRISLLKNL